MNQLTVKQNEVLSMKHFKKVVNETDADFYVSLLLTRLTLIQIQAGWCVSCLV